MPAPPRSPAPGLIDQLAARPQRFEFFQAVRLLEQWLREPVNSSTPRPPQGLPSLLRFRNSVSLAFPPSEIESLQMVRDASPVDAAEPSPAAERIAAAGRVSRVDITPAFMSLLGAGGALPLPYTEQIVQRDSQQKDGASRAFLDLFTHRAVSLFYAAWKKHRLHLQFESDPGRHYRPLVLALAGLGADSLHGRLRPEQGGVADDSLAFFAGALQQRHRSAAQIERLLGGYLRVPVRLEPFQGRWYPLPEAARTSLGARNGVLGCNALAGERVWQRNLRVKAVLGPLGSKAFSRFLPGAPGATALKEVLTLLSGVSLEYEIELTLQADAVRGLALDSHRPARSGRLGWDSHLLTRPQATDRRDVRYDVHRAVAPRH